MTNSILKGIDYFIPKQVLEQNIPDKIWLSRCFVGLLLFFTINLSLTLIVEILGFLHSDFYIRTTIGTLLLILVLYRTTNSLFLCVNILCSFVFIVFFFDIINHGLLFSEPVFFLILIPIFAYIFYNFKLGLFWIGILFLFFIFLYFETTGTIDFFAPSTPYNNPNYSFIINLQFMVEMLGLLFIIDKSKAMVIDQLDSQQKKLDLKTTQLEAQTATLIERTGELERLKSELTVRNENLSKYAATTAHDLKQPIRTMVSFADLLKYELGDNKSERVQEYLDFIIEGGKDMKSQVEKVLDIANLSKGIVFSPLDTKQVLNNTINMLDNQIKLSNAEINIKNVPQQIIANEVSIKKVFQNIISNGIKFNDKEKIKIEISGEETASEWLFSIKDNGNGIDKKSYEQIFDYGVRIETKVEGSGLGLDTCKRLVNLHMGKIWINSSVGIGSEFIFSIKKNIHYNFPHHK